MLKWNSVKTWREAGINAKWSKINGRPVMMIQPTHDSNFYFLSKTILENIEEMISQGKSIKDAVDNVLSLARVFSIPLKRK